jgi:hypothetical protein
VRKQRDSQKQMKTKRGDSQADCQYFLACYRLCSSYGSVYKALDKRDGKLVAIKVLEVENEDTLELQKEINILRECDCEWIVRYKGSYRKDGNIWIVMEFWSVSHSIRTAQCNC